MMTEYSFEEVRETIKELDPKLDETDDSFSTATLLLSSALIGTDEDALRKFTGLSSEFIQPRAERLRESGIWEPEGMVYCDWEDEVSGNVSFWLDVCIAEGLVERREAEDV